MGVKPEDVGRMVQGPEGEQGRLLKVEKGVACVEFVIRYVRHFKPEELVVIEKGAIPQETEPKDLVEKEKT